jgi:hypothetical protein
MSIKLYNARRHGLPLINDDLTKKCGSHFSITLDHFRNKDPDAAVYEHNKDYDLILCLYHNKKCISSVIGKFDSNDMSMEISSKTDTIYEGRKFNLYLRAAFIFLMQFIRPTIKTILSMSVNPISTYTMFKYFNASCPDLDSFLSENNLTQSNFTIDNAKIFHQYYMDKHKQTEESAIEMMNEMLEEYSMEELGWDNEEDGVRFIMETMNPKAIPLVLNLKKEQSNHHFFGILESIPIKCSSSLTRKTKGGGRYKRKNKSVRK